MVATHAPNANVPDPPSGLNWCSAESGPRSVQPRSRAGVPGDMEAPGRAFEHDVGRVGLQPFCRGLPAELDHITRCAEGRRSAELC